MKNIDFVKIQNPPLATACRFESDLGHHCFQGFPWRGCPDLAQERLTTNCDTHIILWTAAFAQCGLCLCGQMSQAPLKLPDNRPQTCSAGDINGFIAFFAFDSDPSSLEGAPWRLDRNRWSLPVASLSPCVRSTSGSSRARTSSEPTNRASFSQPCRLEG